MKFAKKKIADLVKEEIVIHASVCELQLYFTRQSSARLDKLR